MSFLYDLSQYLLQGSICVLRYSIVDYLWCTKDFIFSSRCHHLTNKEHETYKLVDDGAEI